MCVPIPVCISATNHSRLPNLVRDNTEKRRSTFKTIYIPAANCPRPPNVIPKLCIDMALLSNGLI